MGEDVANGELSQSGHADGGAQVVSEHKEGGTRAAVETEVLHTIEHGAHGVLTDTEVEVAASVGLGLAVPAVAPVTAILDQVLGGAVKISRAGHIVRHHISNGGDHVGASNAGGNVTTLMHRDASEQLLHRWGVVSLGILKGLGKGGVGSLPLAVHGLPGIILLLLCGLVGLEVGAGLLRHIPLSALRKTNLHLGILGVPNTSLTVAGVGALHLLNALGNDGLGNDELRLAVVVGLGGLKGLLDGSHVVAVDGHNIPAVRLEAHSSVLGLRLDGHGVEGHIVGIVDDDHVVQALVGSDGGGLSHDTLLHAAITAESHNVVVENSVVVSVELGSSHLLGSTHTNGVCNTLTKRTSGGLNTRGVVLGVRELGVTRGHGVVHTEVLHLLHGQGVASKVQPGVHEHGPVASRQNESVSVHPGGVIGERLQHIAVENGTDFSATKRKTKMAGVGLGDRVHGDTTSLLGGLSESLSGRRRLGNHVEGLDGILQDRGRHLEGLTGEGTTSLETRGRAQQGEHGERGKSRLHL
mmetsp:Transcript_9229/g.15837  ORF Transcript_9229/g.15837 Transcript_9229/m.15837 type:complete len:525 (-) Transcript_9229:48-1622(-)